MKKIIGLSYVITMLIFAGCATAEPPAELTDTSTPVSETQTPETTTPETKTPETQVKTFEISGTNYAFSETEITVNKGDTVKIIFTSEDGFHDWVVDEFNAATEQIQSPAVSEVTFVADKVGTFEYYCSVGNHREMGMVGSLIVNEPPEADHLGCQEGEVDENGKCVVAKENNRALFEKDVDTLVQSTSVDTAELKGLFVTPKIAGDYPGIVMIHEWWGLNDNIKYMAKLLAGEGYNVFAIDMYDGQVAETSDQAGVLATAVRNNPEGSVEKLLAAADYLKTEAGSTKLASLGWCFGGQQSLNLSLNEQLDATVIYYGQLTDDPEQLKNITGPVLGIFGETDQSITVESVRSFEKALVELEIPNNITIYPQVGHAFANPSNSNYAADETVEAWDKTVTFLNDTLK